MPVALAAAALGSLVALALVGRVHFVDHACHNVETALSAHVVGQELALTQLTDAVCAYTEQRAPRKPLVLSVHGPPGVGKTYTHLWLARALYNRRPSSTLQCPGLHCRGYKVVYGQDYLAPEAGDRLAALRREVLGHLAGGRDTLLVVEEYDKLDCAARGMWRQLLAHPERANLTGHRPIILLESNLGMAELEEMLSGLEDRTQVSPEAAAAVLRDVVFAAWRAAGCESYADTLGLLGAVDAFLPYMPLERPQLPALMALGLANRAELLAARAPRAALNWDADVPGWLAARVVFPGRYPLLGARVVEPVLVRHVSRPLRQAAMLPGCKSRAGCTIQISVAAGMGVGDGDNSSSVQRLRFTVRNGTHTASGGSSSEQVLAPPQQAPHGKHEASSSSSSGSGGNGGGALEL